MKKRLVCLLAFICSFTSVYSQQWTALGGGANHEVRGLYADTNNHLLYAVGRFNSIGNQSANRVAAWNGMEWSSLCDFGAIGDASPIIHVTKFQEELIVSGQQYRMGNQITGYIAKFDGTSWNTFGTPNSLGRINVLESEVYGVGVFDTIGGNALPSIARWNGLSWVQAFEENLPWDGISNDGITQIIKYNGKYVVGGNFELGSLKEIALWNGNSWEPLMHGILGDATVNTMVVYKEILYVAGYFTESSGNVSDFLMAWNGEQWFNPFPDVIFSFQVFDLQVINNELYIVSNFHLVNDDKTYTLSKFDGENFCAFGGSTYLTNNSHVDARRIAGLDDKIYIACNNVFLTDTVHYIAQWNGTEMDTCLHQPVYAGVTEYGNNIQSVSVYPNPGNDLFNISFYSVSGSEAELKITDQLGQMVEFINIQTALGENKYELDLGSLSSGIYFLDVSGNTGKIVKR